MNFTKKYNNHSFTFLSNRKILKLLGSQFIYVNYNNIAWIFRDLFSYRKFDIIESNWHRDNILAIINYIIFYLKYKLNNTELIIVIHGVQWLENNSWWKKIIYNFFLKLGFIICKKIIVVSEEMEEYIRRKYLWWNKNRIKKIMIVKNYISFQNPKKIHNWKIQSAILISRLDNEKIWWIIDTIKFCKKYNISLDIYWWWKNLNELKKNNPEIIFHWEILNSNIIISNYDIIFGMWRSLLEWISNNLMPILIWYNEIICSVNRKNFKKLSYSNFSWRWIKKEKHELIHKNIIENKEDYQKLGSICRNQYSIDNLMNYWEK